MRTLALDTTAEMETALIHALRSHSPAEKLKSLAGMSVLSRNLALSGLRSRHPEANSAELRQYLLRRRLGAELAEKMFTCSTLTESEEEDMLSEPQIIALVAKRLEALRVPYFVSGSIASIIHGEERLTKDADLVVRIFAWHIPALVKAFETDFVISAEAMQDALKRRYAFNIIHMKSAFKIDFYPMGEEDEFELDALERCQRHNIGTGEIWVATPEDVILAKLAWFKKGGKVSEQQWRDVLGVLKVQGSRLDFAYLAGQAQRFGLADLLEKAREDAGEVV
jgi:hypothetical protein